MNCQDIARLLDEQEVESLLAGERSDVQAHLTTCANCARDWQIHAQLRSTPIPATPTGLRAQFSARMPSSSNRGGPRRSRFVVIGSIAVAAAAAMLTLYVKSHAPVAAATVTAQAKLLVTQTSSTSLHSPTESMSDDESKSVEEQKAVAEWTRRVAEWLAIRDDPDALITAALLLKTEPLDARRIQSLLQRATAAAPDSARIQATALLLCLALKPCDATSYEQALRNLAPDNALGWAEEVNRASLADDRMALQSALSAMSQARTFDLYWGTSMLSMISRIRAAPVTPPDVVNPNPSTLAIGAFAALPIPAFRPITNSCKSAADEKTLLECRRIGAAMRAGDTLLVNMIGFAVSGSVLRADSDEALSLAQQKREIEWILIKPQETLPADDPSDFLRVLADHPREMDAWRAWLEERGIPTEPPADWKK